MIDPEAKPRDLNQLNHQGWIDYFPFYPSKIPVNYTIYFKKAILSKVKNRFNQDNYSKIYNQNDFLLYFIFQKILIYFDLVSAVHKYCIRLQWYVCTVYQQFNWYLAGIECI